MVNEQEYENRKRDLELRDIKSDIENEDLKFQISFEKSEAQKNMTWFCVIGILLYPIGIPLTDLLGLDNAVVALKSIAPTYFVATSAVIAAFFTAQTLAGKK